MESTDNFLERIKNVRIDNDYDMVSFDVVSLFTNVPIEFTIDVILDKVYNKRLIKTKLSRNELKKLLLLCTTQLHFKFNNQIFRQVEGVSMGSPLGPVLANIFMVALEEGLIPGLHEIMPVWLRYVDDTFTLIKKNKIDTVLNALNAFHDSIKITYEKERMNEIAFLDVKVKRYDNSPLLKTDIYRKKTDSSIYINWNSFAPNTWKVGTLRGLLKRAHKVCTEKQWTDKEIAYLKHVFIDVNQYPRKVVDKVVREVRESLVVQQNQQDEVVISTPPETRGNATEYVKLCTVLPYRGKTGESVINDLKECFKRFVPSEVQTQFSYTGRKLSSIFSVKDKVREIHRSNLVYHYKSDRNPKCKRKVDYVGETRVRLGQRTYEHFVQDKKSAIRQHCKKCRHGGKSSDFKIIGTGYRSTVHRKLAEALYIRDLKPTLNKQRDAFKLHLFN